MNKILLLCGKSCSGKTTVADYLVKKHDYNHYAFADILKEYTSRKYNFDIKLCHTQDGKKKIIHNNTTVRDLLILEANSIKKINPNIFVDFIIDKITNFKSNGNVSVTNFVISDVRYLEEIECIKCHFKNVNVIRINKTDYNKINDPSECQLDNYTEYDYIIDNNNDITELYSKINSLL